MGQSRLKINKAQFVQGGIELQITLNDEDMPYCLVDGDSHGLAPTIRITLAALIQNKMIKIEEMS